MFASSFIVLLVRSRWRLLVYDYDHNNLDDGNHEDDNNDDHEIQCSTQVYNLVVLMSATLPYGIMEMTSNYMKDPVLSVTSLRVSNNFLLLLSKWENGSSTLCVILMIHQRSARLLYSATPAVRSGGWLKNAEGQLYSLCMGTCLAERVTLNWPISGHQLHVF